MARARKKQTTHLALWALGAVLLYHIVNVVGVALQFRGFTGEPYRTRVPGLILPGVRWSSEAPLFDSSKRFLQAIGYSIRHWLGQENDFYFYGPAKPLQRLYVRMDTGLMDARLNEKDLSYPAFIDKLFQDAVCHGVRPFAVFVPPKTAIERERLPARLPLPKLWKPDTGWAEETDAGRRLLAAHPPKHWVDLYGIFRRARQNGEVYVPWDYHLTNYGMAVVTTEIVNLLNSEGESLGEPEIRQVGMRPRDYSDVLISMLNLPDMLLSRPEFGWSEPLYEVRTPGRLTKWKRVVLAGTSFTDRLDKFGQGLPTLLEKAMHVPVKYLAANGSTADTILKKLVDKGVKLEAGDVFILEQPLDHILREASAYPSPWAEERSISSTISGCEQR